MIPANRHSEIISKIRKDGSVEVKSLSSYFDVSELTIRRDLDILAKKGILERRHGGAVLLKAAPIESDFNLKAQKAKKEKMAIAQKAIAFVENGDTIFINSGSTTLELLKLLFNSPLTLTIVTNNVDIFTLKEPQKNITLIFTGGIYRKQSRSVSGQLSTMIIDNIFASKAFIGIDGLSLNAGLTTPVYEESISTRRMIEKTIGKVFVIADSSKIGIVSNYKTVDLDGINALITDRKGSEMFKDSENIEFEIYTAD